MRFRSALCTLPALCTLYILPAADFAMGAPILREYSSSGEHLRPSDSALQAAAWASSTVHDAQLRLRLGFANVRYVVGFALRSDDPPTVEQPTLDLDEAAGRSANSPRGIRPVSGRWRPPLARLLRRTGGLDAVGVKLAVTAFWMARAAPEFEIAEPAATWARLLDLPAPDSSGARRVRAAMSTLEDLWLIETTSRPPRPTLLRLRREDGTGRGYTLPQPKEAGTSDYFFRVPAVLWSGGWLSGLSGPALTVLLVVLSRRNFEPPYPPVWMTQRQVREEHGLSYRTWWEGVRELEEFHLLDRFTQTRKGDSGHQSKTTVAVRDDRLAEGLAPAEWQQVQADRARRPKRETP